MWMDQSSTKWTKSDTITWCEPKNQIFWENFNFLIFFFFFDGGGGGVRQVTDLSGRSNSHCYYKKKAKIIKRALTFRNYAHLYKIENLDSFNLELQLKNTEFAIKNKLKNLFNKLRGLKFAITLILKNRKQ